MSHSRFQKSALAAAVLSLGFSMGALAQGSAGSSASGTTSSATGTAAANGGASGASAANRSGSSGSAMSDSSDSMTSRAATSTANGKSTGSDKMAKSDRNFLEEAYIGSMAEVRLGKLAQDKASSQEVKDFGQRMVDDHTREIENLSKIAKEEGVKLPSQLDSKHQKTYDRLAKLSGAEFDRAYMKEMTSDHKKDVSKYEHAAKSAKDEQLQQHAKQEVATLREHEKMAKSTMDDVKKGSTVSMRTDNDRSSRAASNMASSPSSSSASNMPSNPSSGSGSNTTSNSMSNGASGSSHPSGSGGTNR